MSQDAYEVIDEFLRNNLDDEDYAQYSKALDELVSQPVGLTTCRHCGFRVKLNEAPQTDEMNVTIVGGDSRLKTIEVHLNEWPESPVIIGSSATIKIEASPEYKDESCK